MSQLGDGEFVITNNIFDQIADRDDCDQLSLVNDGKIANSLVAHHRHSDGVDQFKPARKVTQIQDRHAWVDGSQTGIPICEVTVAEPPAPILVVKLTAAAKSGPSDNEGDDNGISVLVTPQGRLQISADLDVKGIGKLKQMLEQYEQILKLLQ